MIRYVRNNYPERSFKECVCFASKLSINVPVVCVIRVGLFMVGIILQSAPCGALHDGNGSVAPTSRYGDTNAPAVSRVQCLHVLPGLLSGGAYVSREAKLNYITVTETEQCCYIPCGL